MLRHLRFMAPLPLACLVALWPTPGRAIDPDRTLADCTVEVWRAREGLPGAWVRAIAQSPDGYLWIGTQGGLARYGGGPLVPVLPDAPFEHAADVMGLATARDGTVWLRPARGQPLCVRAGVIGSCFSGSPRALAGERIADLSPDATGAVWIAAAAGVYRAAEGRLELVAPASRWGGAPPSAVHRDRQGRVWVGTAAGLFVAPAGPHAPGPLALHVGPRGPLAIAVSALHENRRGQLWVAAERTLLLIADGKTVAFTGREGLPEGRLTTILEDRDGNVWVGSREGLIRFQPGRGFAHFHRGDGLPDGDVSALYEDREGSLWVGTRAGGLAQFTDRTLDRRSGPPSLRDQWVSTVAEDQTGALWAATGRGLTRFAGGEERTYGVDDGLPADEVLSVHPGRPGELWVGTARGLARLQGGRAEAVPALSTAVSALHGEADGSLWIGDAEGLARLRDGRLERFALGEEPERAELRPIRSIARDDQEVIWISGNGNLRRLEGDRLRPDPAAAAIGKVRAMARDSDGSLWLGTGAGLVRRRRGAWQGFGPAQGFGRSDLFQVMPDGHGFLWVGATPGILRVSRASLEEVAGGRRPSADVVTFEIADERREVRVTRTRQPGSWKGRDGRLHFASSRGVVTVDPRRLPVNALPPPVLIEKALVDGRPAGRGSANRFPPGSGALEFHFAAITLIEPRKAQHRYRLEGFDPGWVEAGTRRAAYYTNMRPGRYRFRVQGSNADGVWNESGDVLELELAPHFFQTAWFFALAGLLALALALSVHRLRVAQLRARDQATSAERARMARELHDSLLQGMAAALMHLRGLRKRFAPEAPAAPIGTVAEEIKQIEELVAGNIEETRQAVWDLRERPVTGGDAGEGRTLGDELGDLVARLTPAPNLAIEVHRLVEGQPLPVPRQVRHELLRIAHEALTNALKHAGARKVEAQLRYEEGAIRLRVCDDGRGFDPAAAAGVPSGHFGLTGMRERGSLLGQFRVESRPGKGTMVEVTANLKDLRDV